MDTFDELWGIQKKYSDGVNAQFESPEQGTKQLTLGMVSELGELLREIAWKQHRREDVSVVRSNILEEIIDLQKYVWSQAILWGFSSEEFVQAFKSKSEVVEQRWHQEMSLNRLHDFEHVVGVDIDGVLADYPTSFFRFVEEQGFEVPEGAQTTYDLANSLNISAQQLAYLKHQYRESGYKRIIPVLPRAREFTEWLQTKGYGVALLTARPYKQYKRIFSDTLYWLNSNNIAFDAVLFDEEKNIRLYREFGHKVKFFVEDDMDKAYSIANMGILVYLLDKPYNSSAIPHPRIVRVTSLDQIERIEG